MRIFWTLLLSSMLSFSASIGLACEKSPKNLKSRDPQREGKSKNLHAKKTKVLKNAKKIAKHKTKSKRQIALVHKSKATKKLPLKTVRAKPIETIHPASDLALEAVEPVVATGIREPASESLETQVVEDFPSPEVMSR